MKRDCVNHTKETDAHWGSGANKRPVLPNSLPRPGCVSSGRLYNLSEFCSSIKRISRCAAFQGWLLEDLGIDLALDLSSVTEGRLSLEVIRGVSLSSLESKGLRGMCIRQVPRTLARAEVSSLLLSVPRGGPRLDIPGGLVCLSPSLRQWMCRASSSGLSPGPLHGHLPLLASSGGCPHGLAHSLGYLLRLEPKLEEGGSCGFYVSSNSSKLECFPRAE